ncbi:putative O-linked N-acetylglucosamine transferase (SPINDLY family) [Pseudomonas fluvialis]|uniref:Putative O-linked N-acetylglucosamine transferase (SPINDLY family) n=1 Tax=Pseudomonas fluvialis TaxID=1793966 RepID=A0A7X0BTX9_9PSED|nr:acetylglucosamine transferase [Pseudomonas fluvialis]MBB6342607.1 putative O-linked N-acetylglucosamine transferase (SPINDLY family) [Pseudomonas fluvialis]
MPESSVLSVNLDTAFLNALQLSEQASLEPMQLIAVAERLGTVRRHTDVVRLYQSWLAHCRSTADYIVQFNLGVTLSQLEQLPAAEQAYRSAIQSKPDFVQAWFNLGAVIERQGRADNALIIWQSMLDHPLVGPELNRELYLMVLNSMGRLMEETRQLNSAEAKLLASLQADPEQPKVIQHWVHLRQKQCEWPVFTELEQLSLGEMLKATSPLAMLSATDDPGLQLATAQRFVSERVNQRVAELAPRSGYQHERLRIGFLSSDFCLHAVSLLTVELFELLDRQAFEVYGFCWSREDGSALRARVKSAMDYFIPIGALDDAEAAQLIRQQEIDVLVDLQGLTSGARPNILAFRPAPVQVTYLGFPGPTGLPCVDYVIADEYLIPDSEKPFYSERPLYLPVFQCSDRQRPVAALPSRAECGLPEDRFVFCCFNNNYKFNEEQFDCWMRILQQVPGSVFWLLADNQWSQANLCARAESLGVARERLIFAPRVAPELYLARYTVADLFLDAYPFNGGTTANDALWMGLPVLTRSGRTFASRMAGSLLTALDLPELITRSLSEYEQRAVELAKDKQQLGGLRQRLKHGRENSLLFDMPSFVRSFEAGLSRAYARLNKA